MLILFLTALALLLKQCCVPYNLATIVDQSEYRNNMLNGQITDMNRRRPLFEPSEADAVEQTPGPTWNNSRGYGDYGGAYRGNMHPNLKVTIDNNEQYRGGDYSLELVGR